jgi:oligoribonuclease (3'-5' exoribonuclease)
MGYEYSPFQVSHRILDMSSIRTAAALQGINMYKFDAAGAVAHRALDDVERDIAQWVGYLAATTPDNGTVGKQ